MERFTISKSEKQTIYEIYRACRICGAGGGYRMPIIQNIIDLEISDVELRQKIQDCLQLEVRSDDRMPPLICELCVDKVNDFYDFLELSRQTNIRTRTRLGLPLQMARKGESDNGDTILGVTEPLHGADSPAPKRSTAGPKCSKKIKKEPETVNVKIEPTVPSPVDSRSSSVSSRSSRTSRRPPTPPRPARVPARSETPKVTPVTTQEKKRGKEKEKEPPKGKESNLRGMGKELQDLLQDNQKYDGNTSLAPRSMKRKETEPPRPTIIPKRTRTTTKEPVIEPIEEPTPTPTPPPRSKPGPKSRKVQVAPKEDPKSKQVAPREDPKSKQVAPKEDPKSKQVVPKEDLKSKQVAAKEAPKSKQVAPKVDPKSKQVAVKEDPKSKQVPPKEDPKIPVPLRILKSKSKLAVASPKVETPPPPSKTDVRCFVCDAQLKTVQGLSNHLKIHVPTYTKPQHACDPCGKWFVNADETATHHRYHRSDTFPYHCRRCFGDFNTLLEYDSHIANGLCMPYDLVPDVKCDRCWKTFVTRNLMDAHKCQGYDGRPGGNCTNCSRTYATLRTLKAHQKTCTYKKKQTGDLIADPDVLRRLKPMQVRICRCDDLLTSGGPYDVSTVKPNHGLDKNYIYPYIKLKPVKPKPLRYRGKVGTHGPIRSEPERDGYTHWDSEDSDSDSVIKKVDSLTTLCLKKLFTKNMIGKVPRKKRKVNNDAFDCDDFSMGTDLNDIISSLNDDLRSDGVRKNRKDSLISIAINDIIGVPNSYVSVGNDNVARSSNSVHTDGSNKNDSNLSDRNEGTNDNDNAKDLNDVQIENEGNDTVVSASDISTELNLIESEDHTRNDAASESMGDDMETNDTKTRNDSHSKKSDDLNNDEIRNFKSVDGKSNDWKERNDSVVQYDHLKSDENTDLNHCDMEIDNLDSHNKSLILDAKNDAEIQNSNNENENNYSEMSNDNLEIKNRVSEGNCENTDLGHSEMDIDNSESQNKSDNVHTNNNSETQSSNNMNENKGSEMCNDNLEIKDSCDNDVNNDSEALITKNENTNDSEMGNDKLGTENIYNNDGEGQNENNVNLQLDNETNVQNDNLDTTNSLDNDMSNDLKTLNENLKAISQSNGTDTLNANFDKSNSHTETNKKSQVSERIQEGPRLQNSIDNEQNSTVNGIHEKSEETKKITKESPIKHSIENLIGDTEKNPDKYIDEVISSIEDIINKNPRNEDTKDNFTSGENSNQMDDQMLMDALDTHIGDAKDKIEDKITLDDILPKDNHSTELDDISDDDYNFDA